MEAAKETDRSLICLFILAVTFHFVSGILPSSLSYSCPGCCIVNSWYCCVRQSHWCASLTTFLKIGPGPSPLDLDLSPWTWTFIFGPGFLLSWIYFGLEIFELECKYFELCVHIWHKVSIRSTPPTSPQCAQSTARQAERDQRQLGSPPSRRHPHSVMQPSDVPLALRVCLF